MCFVAPEQKLFYGNFCYLTLSSVYWNKYPIYTNLAHAPKLSD